MRCPSIKSSQRWRQRRAAVAALNVNLTLQPGAIIKVEIVYVGRTSRWIRYALVECS